MDDVWDTLQNETDVAKLIEVYEMGQDKLHIIKEQIREGDREHNKIVYYLKLIKARIVELSDRVPDGATEVREGDPQGGDPEAQG